MHVQPDHISSVLNIRKQSDRNRLPAARHPWQHIQVRKNAKKQDMTKQLFASTTKQIPHRYARAKWLQVIIDGFLKCLTSTCPLQSKSIFSHVLQSSENKCSHTNLTSCSLVKTLAPTPIEVYNTLVFRSRLLERFDSRAHAGECLTKYLICAEESLQVHHVVSTVWSCPCRKRVARSQK